MKFLPSITVLTLMFFQINRTFVHLSNKNECIVYEIKTFIAPNNRLAIKMPLYSNVYGFIHVLKVVVTFTYRCNFEIQSFQLESMRSIISRKGMKCPHTDYALDLKTIFLADQQKAALCESDVCVSGASCISGPPVDLFWWKILLMLPQVRAIAVVA